jgi:peptide/nickel transport system substrate-binding protein
VNRRLSAWLESAKRQRRVPFLDRVSSSLKNLSAGDRVIAGVLAAFVVIAAVAALYALEQHLLVQVPAQGGSLTEGEVGNPRFVNPLLAISDPDRDLTALTYAGLMGVDGSGALVPVLASSYTVSPDGKTYTVTIRPDAKFSDGTPVTAADVVFTVEKAQDPTLESPEYADWSGVTATAVATNVVQFVLDKPYAPFLANLTLGILPENSWQSISDAQFPFSNLNVQPIGAGPFVVSSVARDSSGLITSYTLKANPEYVLGRPYLDSMHFIFYTEQQDLQTALDNGTVGAAYGLATAPKSSQVLTAPYSRVFGVFFNPASNALFARPEVREALSLVIDRDNIVQNVLGGYASAILGPVPPGSGVNEVPVPSYADPVAEAANVLEAAGWTYDGTNREWVNAKASLTMSDLTIKTSNVPELKAVASAVKADWQQLGIETDIELYEPGDLNQNVIRPRKYDALLFGEVIGRSEDLYAFWDSSQKADPGLNIADYSDSTVDALLEDARETSDQSTQLSDLQSIENDIAAEYPAAFVYAPDFVYAVPGDLKGVELPQISDPEDRFASVQDWYVHTQSVWPFFASTRGS